jgi:magnesium transporter
MPRFTRRISGQAGLPPGELVHIGEVKLEETRISLLDYSEQQVQEKGIATLDNCVPPAEDSTVRWINVDGLHQIDVLEGIGALLGLHPLVLEDILNTGQRPKVEDYGDYLFFVLKMLHLANGGDEILEEQISLVLGDAFVASFQERTGDVFQPVRERITTDRGRVRKMGADYLAYCLLDLIIDNYFVVLEGMGDRIELLEEEVVANPDPQTVHAIHDLKRELILLRRSVWPLREVIGRLQREESPLIRDSTEIYLRDVYDHTIQVIDTVETFRDLLSGMLDIYLSSVSNRMNEVMKVLTIIATIFIPLTLVAGIYGMNFQYMPELAWRWGYPSVWVVMLAIGAFMVAYFRRKRWL